ncbi:PIF-3 [Lymantria xylina nucleopolyhedrovirus]|uniref:PIF-3 n=1 Tax=Lymantria xylina multiple nucleopolyhedrovirus TaxID=2847840 RepID=D4N2E9_9ABAC|nr:PIF-3 [Lymantria xylina nucleopolyhedrovirus]ADD73821.1 PIF-3 [Lymantria xylina nucleopolyhedrovirus]
MDRIVGFVVLIAALLIAVYYCLQTAVALGVPVDAPTPTALELVFERNGIVNCARTRLPCVRDDQCRDNCARQVTAGEFECEEGFCAIRESNATSRPDDFECDQRLGLLNVFAASEFAVAQTCVSVYRELIDDLGSPRPYLCEGGALAIDLVERQFSANDCRCADGFRKMAFDQTALARSIPVCIPTRLADVYSRFYTALD